MIASIVILVLSLGLFVYWFRYMCQLILCAKTSRDYAGELAAANDLHFAAIGEQLRTTASREQLDRFRGALERDYEIIAGLLRHSGDASAVEDIMLKVDYRVMGAWYPIARSFSDRHAAIAMSEMCQIVNHFANTMGERSFCSAEL